MAAAPDAPRAVITLVQDGREVPLGAIDQATRCDLGLVDDLLRLQLHAKRLGWTLRISEVRADLRELFQLVGLTRQLD
jgi:ABC-type transporter Mla MlaB component